VKPTIKHTAMPPKPQPLHQAERNVRQPTRQAIPTKSRSPSKADSQDFKRLMDYEPDLHAEPIGDLLFYFNDTPSDAVDESTDQKESHPFTAMTPDLIEGIEDHETLPAEFSLLLPETGEVRARLTEGEEGETCVSLGFESSILPRMIGIEKDAEWVLSQRMGKRIRLRFKRIDAL